VIDLIDPKTSVSPRMRLRRFLLSFGLANLCFNGVEYAVTAQSETRPTVLSAEDMMRILPGNTLLAYDKNGPFWMYFPEPGTVWGQSSDGDVDIGHWWIDGDQYCRSWRVWYAAPRSAGSWSATATIACSGWIR